jgi:uncharacterized protein (DUF697 family)/tellurite resistance protein
MDDRESQAIVTIALIAALADGQRQPEEERELERIATAIGGGDYGALARRVLAGQVSLGDVAGTLGTVEARRTAFETAVLVCHADGAANQNERAFLAELRSTLRLSESDLGEVYAGAVGLATAPASGPRLDFGRSPSGGGDPWPAPSPSGPRPSQAGMPAISADMELDDLILKQAMLAGALELLPQGLATLAVVPLQTRMVYQIGADFGQKLDAAQIADLAGATGIGAAAQVLEGTARKLLGGLAKGVLGRTAGAVAGTATGVALTFATTYALGHAAKEYYARGRSLSRSDLRALFSRLREEADTIFPRVEAQIREQAARLNLGELLERLRPTVSKGEQG